MNSPNPPKRIDIIVADEHSMSRKGLKDYLLHIGYVNRVDEAGSGNEALALLKKKKYHLVFTGYDMPGMNGEIAAQAIHQRYPDTKVIAFSRRDDSFTVHRMFLAGCSGYVHKKGKDEEIEKAMSAVFQGKLYFTDLIGEKLAGESEADCYARLHRKYALGDLELQMIVHTCNKLNTKQIAAEMNTTPHAVEKLRSSVYQKTGTHSPVELIYFAMRHKLIQAENL